jgi:two-component system, sensor histidine kinase PdtaS
MEQLTIRQLEVETLNDQLQRAMTETHHRVKNNLQIMAAMIDMQVMDAEFSVPVNELRRLNRHIRTLAVIHDLLTQKAREDGRAEVLSARAVLLQLVPMLQQTAGPKEIDLSSDDVPLTSRQGTSLALVTNELVSNALKHGKTRIQVRFTVQEDRATLEVRDDGPGFPPDFDASAQANTGLELVENLSRWDLDGRAIYSHAPEGGACVRVEFPVRS